MRTRRKFERATLAIAFLALLLGVGGNVHAGQITYSEMATASGTLGANAFTDALVTVTLTGDSANVVLDPSGLGFVNKIGTFMVKVAGVGTATFTDSGLFVFDNPKVVPIPAVAGFSDLTVGRPILGTVDSAFRSYDLTTAPFGPVTSSLIIAPDATFPTTLGGLNITQAGESTFLAVATPLNVPEPAGATLMGLGVVGLGFWARRRRAVA
jgi:hypothetical protein